VYLQTAYGTNATGPYALYNFPFTNGTSQSFLLEFLSVDRRPFTNGIALEITVPVKVVPPTGATLTSWRYFTETYAGFDHQVLEFVSITGRSYMVLYGNSPYAITNVAIPSIKATANKTDWIDGGPPKTSVRPESRFYKVIMLP
jgi:hypothetical protein